MYERKPKSKDTLPELKPGPIGRSIDWFAAQVSPSWAAKRAISRRFASQAYDNLSSVVSKSSMFSKDHSRLRSNRYVNGRMSPDAEANDSLEDVQSECLELYKTTDIAHGSVESRVANEIGQGIRFQSRVREGRGITEESSKVWNEQIEDVIHRWSAAGIDRTGRKSLYACQRIVCRSFANMGEMFVEFVNDPVKISPLPLTWDLLDPFQIVTPPKYLRDPLVRLGIRYDKFGRVVGYYKRKTVPGDLHSMSFDSDDNYEYVPRFDKKGFLRIAHVFEQVFPKQTRGWPWLAATRNTIKDLQDWKEAEIIRKQIEACFVAFIKSGSFGSPYDMAEAAAATRDTSGRRIEELSPGMIEYLSEDEEITFGNPNQGAPIFAPFVEQMLRFIASGTNSPYETISKDFTRSSFASGRLSLLDGRMGYLARRQPICQDLLSPTYKILVRQGMMSGEIDSSAYDLGIYNDRPHLYERHACLAPGWQFIDPAKEVKSHTDAIAGNIETVSDALNERGVEFDEHMAVRSRERRAEIDQEVALRQYQWDLEESAGLPHQADPEPEEETSDTEMAGANDES